MDKPRFYVDDEWLVKVVLGMKSDINALSEYVELLESTDEHRHFSDLYSIADFFSLQVAGVDIGNFVFSNFCDGNLRDLIVRLQIVLEKAEICRVKDKDVSGSEALSFHGMGGWVSSADPTRHTWWVEKSMHWLSASSLAVSIIRKIFTQSSPDYKDLDEYAACLFPDIYFFAQPSDFKNTGLSYQDSLGMYMAHLSYLNDFAYSDFKAEVLPHVLIAKAGARGIEMSPESPQTHKNKSAMKERDIHISGVKICCEWHTKLEKTQGRIHFYPWMHEKEEVLKVVGKKVIVGLVVNHLT